MYFSDLGFLGCSFNLAAGITYYLPCLYNRTPFLSLKVYGALRVAVKMLLMWNSEIRIDGGGNTVVTTSVLEVRNLAVLNV